MMKLLLTMCVVAAVGIGGIKSGCVSRTNKEKICQEEFVARAKVQRTVYMSDDVNVYVIKVIQFYRVTAEEDPYKYILLTPGGDFSLQVNTTYILAGTCQVDILRIDECSLFLPFDELSKDEKQFLAPGKIDKNCDELK